MTALMTMIFLHIIADFNLQGMLGDLKQKRWWDKNYPEKKYKRDYIACLLIHSFSWSYMILIPISIMNAKVNVTALLVNMIIHAIIDHIKANKLAISLKADQLAHLIQIFVTWWILVGGR